jgi:hypothetical protein
MFLGSTKALTVKGRPALEADNLTTPSVSRLSRDPRRLKPLWVSSACYRDSYGTKEEVKFIEPEVPLVGPGHGQCDDSYILGC